MHGQLGRMQHGSCFGDNWPVVWGSLAAPLSARCGLLRRCKAWPPWPCAL